MSVIHNDLLLSGDDGYNLTRSLRFRSSASAYLNRTPASAGNRKTWTWSAWVKRGSIGSRQTIFAASADGNNENWITFQSADYLTVYNYESATQYAVETTQLFRDPSAWYHIIVALDTTQATSSNRLKIYVNGSEVTALRTTSYPSQNFEGRINNTVAHAFGRSSSAFPNYSDCYLAEVNFIDGQALTPSSFGQTSSTTGVWQPKKYAGTYGTNGFYLPFTDNSALTSGSNAGLGKDFSGNGNYWNTNNISITSGSTYDSMVDVPTQPTSSSETYPPCNYAVFSPIAPASQTNSEANLKVSTASVNATPATIFPSSGKWYAEIALVSGTYHRVGICNTAGIAQDLGGSANGWCYLSDGRIYNNGSTSSYGVTSTNGDIINIALDLDAGKIWYGKNGTWMASGSPSTGANPSQTFTANQSMSFAVGSGSGTIVYTGNFGQRPFAYTPPTGYVALNTYNLPTPTIGATASSQANKYFDAVKYTGTGGSSSTITGINFQPDLVWLKDRTTAWNNCLFDANRGAGKLLQSNLTNAETTNDVWGYVSAFNSNGFSLTAGSSGIDQVSQLNDAFISWNWKANGSGSSNTAGSITSTVSANTTSGFSVVTWTGNATAGATVGHGLGVAPKMIILKNRSGSWNWGVYHASLGATQYIYLDTTGAAGSSVLAWNNTAPSSTVFTLGSGGTFNSNSNAYVAYCFSEVAGFSKFGSYTGNGNADGPFIYTGFRPKFILTKRTNTTGDWYMWDAIRSPSNAVALNIWANYSSAEYNYGADGTQPWDFLSNGFKPRVDSIINNTNGDTYIYMAFAEFPFRYSLAR